MEKETYEREVTVRLFQVSNALQVLLDKMLKPSKLTAKQFFMMIIIGSFEEDPTLTQLADAFKTSHQNVKQVVLKLEKNGFVTLYKDELDARIKRVCFSDQANQFWAKRDENDEKTMGFLYEDISIEHMKIVQESLLSLIDKVERMGKTWE